MHVVRVVDGGARARLRILRDPLDGGAGKYHPAAAGQVVVADGAASDSVPVALTQGDVVFGVVALNQL